MNEQFYEVGYDTPNKALYSLGTIVGLSLTGVCMAHCIGSIFVSIGAGNGFGMLGNIIALLALAVLFATTVKYHDTVDMQWWPAVAMCLYLGSNLILLFGNSWTLALMILPLIAMILQIAVFPEWGLLGIIAGVMMFLLNIIGGMIAFRSNTVVAVASMLSGGRISSMYLVALLCNNNSLMGIACACLFSVFPTRNSIPVPVPSEERTKSPTDNSAFF